MNLKLHKLSKVSMAFLMALFSVSGSGQINMAANGTYTQDFNTLKTSGTAAWSNNSTLANWYAVSFNNSYTAEAGTTTAGGLKSYGTGTSTERALGSAGSGSATPAYGVVLRNTSGGTITDIKISYTGEQWRNGGNTDVQLLRFYYRKSSSAITSVTAGATTYTAVPALNFASKVGTATAAGLDGNVAANRTVISDVAIPSLSLADDEYIILKWDDENDSGNDHGLSIDDLTVTWTIASASPTWDGTQWVGGTPTASTGAIIAGNYTGPGFTAQSVTVNSTFTLTINSGETVTTGNLVNNGAVIVNDGGNLIQTAAGIYSGAGAFTVNKNGASALDKYAFWSSPVASQNLNTMYGAGVTPAFITEYNTATDYFVNAASTTSVIGKGYSIKTPVAGASAIFTGAPNNGTQTYTLATTGSGHNLVGNPYPSNLNLDAFYTANTGKITNTFYFWDNTSNSVTTQGGTTSVNIGYATYNALNQTWVPAPNIAAVPTGNVANIGQGFFVQTLPTPTDTSLSFSNDMRVATTGTFFNKTNSSTEGKFWLRINSSYNTNNTFAVAYLSPASDAYDNYDSKAIATGSDAFYTIADAQKLLIQGKAAFDTDDVVPVGNKHFENGNFVISLVQKEGIFNNGQAIYLHDKVAGTYTNLQNGTYSFNANSGEVTNRFEIVYKLDVLGTSEVEKNAFEVYRDGEDFFVRNDKNIETVVVFDAAGRKITQINANTKLVRVKLDAKGLYILKAVSDGKEYSKKLIK